MIVLLDTEDCTIVLFIRLNVTDRLQTDRSGVATQTDAQNRICVIILPVITATRRDL